MEPPIFDHDNLFPLMQAFKRARGDDAYERFAKETYNRVYDDMKEALGKCDGKPLLVMSGEIHGDTDFDLDVYKYTPDFLENPAFAAAVTHMAITQAAIDLVGESGVAFNLEAKQLELFEKTLRENEGERFNFVYPSHEAARFADKSGVRLFAGDPLNGMGIDNPERYTLEIEALQKKALMSDSTRIVVCPRGTAHFGTLQGHDLQDVREKGNELTRNLENDPFKEMYGQTLFYNSVQSTPYLLFKYDNQSVAYAQNPANAIQIDPPGAMCSEDKFLIGYYVQKASAERLALENADKAPQVAQERVTEQTFGAPNS